MMTIVHFSDTPAALKKLTKKEALHENALLTIANAKVLDRLKAKEMFKTEWEEVIALSKELEILLNNN